jgi:hypothetical protein
MVATYTSEGDSFRAGRPQEVSGEAVAPLRPASTMRYFDVRPDGQRFAIAPARTPSLVKQDKWSLSSISSTSYVGLRQSDKPRGIALRTTKRFENHEVTKNTSDLAR